MLSPKTGFFSGIKNCGMTPLALPYDSLATLQEKWLEPGSYPRPPDNGTQLREEQCQR